MLAGYSPFIQTLLGTGLTWAVTALGAVFCALYTQRATSSRQHLLLDCSLGFSAGVMVAASFWSLLDPAISMAIKDLHMGAFAVFPAAVGICLGATFVALAELFLPQEWLVPVKLADENMAMDYCVDETHSSYVPDQFDRGTTGTLRFRKPVVHCDSKSEKTCDSELQSIHLSLDKSRIASGSSLNEGLVMNRRLWLLIFAVTIHNIPEGLAVGIAFGGIGQYADSTLASARNLAIGIAIQNFPEGLAVSLPLRAAGYNFWRSFWFGQLSGLVEPVAGLLGCLAVQFFRVLLPYALGFAAGAMLFVVFDDVIPEAQHRGNGHLASVCAMVGFIVMMILDVATSFE
ncbi:DNA polymerase epsilon subunit 1 [Paragonimus heterotremus]|uniref:Zinc transporter ZIP11 n=1 Tax=Paragonimus heterotremus TaxID=100268 RepID=A0A8J4TRL6_9TREM|nr:DNA polymerase epsilon subunit 1 [Paragonimus heterotremus]